MSTTGCGVLLLGHLGLVAVRETLERALQLFFVFLYATIIVLATGGTPLRVDHWDVTRGGAM